MTGYQTGTGNELLTDGTYNYLCPCQLAGTNFVWAVWRRLNRGTGRCSFSHRAIAA